GVVAARGGLHHDGRGKPGLAPPGAPAEPVEIGHYRVAPHRVDERPPGTCEQRRRSVATIEHDRVIAGARHHIFEQPPLNRIVVYDKDTLGHADSHPTRISADVPIWGTVAKEA